MGLGERAAITLAMVFHELATNSVKHGCLSAATGMLDVATRVDGADLVIVWAESGGPKVRGLPTRAGFGSTYIKRTVAGQFGGSIEYDWEAEGLVARLRLPANSLVS
jgi:two-component sensor histidine kinase